MTGNKKGFSSLSLLIGVAIYFTLVGLVFSFFPASLSDYTVTTTTVNNTIFLNQTGEDSGNFGVEETFGFLDFMYGLATFSLHGFPAWVSVLFVYIPVLILVVGIVGLLRGV